LVAAAEAVKKDGDGVALWMTVWRFSRNRFAPGCLDIGSTVVMKGNGVAVRKWHLIKNWIRCEAGGEKAADDRLQMSAADKRVRAEGREVEGHGA